MGEEHVERGWGLEQGREKLTVVWCLVERTGGVADRVWLRPTKRSLPAGVRNKRAASACNHLWTYELSANLGGPLQREDLGGAMSGFAARGRRPSCSSFA